MLLQYTYMALLVRICLPFTFPTSVLTVTACVNTTKQVISSLWDKINSQSVTSFYHKVSVIILLN